MTSTPAAAPATTRNGDPLPVMALPQRELLTVDEKDIPRVSRLAGSGVYFKPLRLDVENGVWVVLGIFEPGARLPMHYHTGAVDAWTISGCWYYLEYPDQPQTAGSYLYEPGASVHTLICPETNTEDTVALFRVSGSNINFSEEGQFESVLDAAMLSYLTEAVAAEQNLGPINYIGGGAAGYAVKNPSSET